MRKKSIGFALSAMFSAPSFFGALLYALCSVAEAQQLKKVSRIGILAGQSPSAASSRIDAFRRGVVELGYTESL